MKKILFCIISAVVFCVGASAQSKAIGARLGGDVEASYQHWLGRHFAEFDLGLTFGYSGGVRLSGAYDFVLTHPGNWNVYLGPSAQLGLYSYSDKPEDPLTNHFGIGLGLQTGVEYQLQSIPMNISLDWRPMWNVFSMRGIFTSVALGLRYRF